MADLDLTGRGARAEGPSRSSGPRPGPSATADAARKRAEDALKGDLEGVFGRIANLLEAREDEELAQAIDEDRKVLSAGLISLTSSVTPLRAPLVLAVHLVEPILAFGRIAAILVGRLRRKFYVEEGEESPAA